MKDSKNCFNCDYELEEGGNFCPNCGQKVDDNNLTLKSVLVEFYENYLSFDTKLGRSIFPFLFVPGKLTKKFIDGKRVSFVNPFRFYLIISVLFFYSLGMVLNQSFSSDGTQKSIINEKISEEVKKAQETQGLKKLSHLLDSIQMVDSTQLTQLDYDSVLKANGLAESISIDVDDKVDSLETEEKKTRNGIFLSTDGSNLSFDFSDFRTVKKYRYDFEYSNIQLLDTLGVDPDSISEYRYSTFKQAMKLYRSNSKVITKFVLGNYSIAMFALIPLLALILMLFYYKSKIPYVAHLIHSLQLHTFSLLIYSISLQFMYHTEIPKTTVIAFLITVIYFYFSFKRVYDRPHFSSFLRLVGVGVIYYIVWASVIMLGLIVSFLLF